MDDFIYCFEDKYNNEFTNIIFASSILASCCGAKIIRLISKDELPGSDFDLSKQFHFNIISKKEDLKQCNSNFILTDNLIETPKYCYAGVSNQENYNSTINFLNSAEVERAIIYSGSFVTTDCNSTIAVYNKQQITSEKIIPSKFKMQPSYSNGFKGATSIYNMETLKNIFNLNIKDCKADAIVLNSALILCIANIAHSIMDGVIQSYSRLNKADIDLNKILETDYI